ncbi:MAG: GtrA family protein [Clostridium beijerinckii]|jgi:putative flippase GtrA|nr:GtrA family protein [Clostridium beijerinckii]
MSNRKKKWSIMKQFLKFGIVGVSNTLISLLIYYILIYFDIDYVVANAIGFIVGVLNSYYWNNKYVFDKSHSGNIKPIIKTFLSYGLTFILSTILLVVMVDFFIFSKVVAPIINLIITIPLNFLLNKFWAFR